MHPSNYSSDRWVRMVAEAQSVDWQGALMVDSVVVEAAERARVKMEVWLVGWVGVRGLESVAALCISEP